LSDKSRAYWAHHRVSFFSSCARLLSTPVQTLMTSLVVAIALALPATLYIALNNVQELGDSWDANPKISAYLNPRAKENAIEDFIVTLKKLNEVSDVEYLSAEQALIDFQARSGFGETLTELEENPRPPTLIITPVASVSDPDTLKLLGERLLKEALIDDVSLDMEWVRRLREIMILGKKIVVALAAILGLGVLLAIGNTIRLAIENRKEEIVVTKLVGGTDGFVRRPFMYSGAWYGFFGGVLACIIVALGYLSINQSVQRLADLYQSGFQLHALGLEGNAILLASATLLGLFGSWLAVSRHLSQIQPR
jgi:cell division transport system permease protein